MFLVKLCLSDNIRIYLDIKDLISFMDAEGENSTHSSNFFWKSIWLPASRVICFDYPCDQKSLRNKKKILLWLSHQLNRYYIYYAQ